MNKYFATILVADMPAYDGRYTFTSEALHDLVASFSEPVEVYAAYSATEPTGRLTGVSVENHTRLIALVELPQEDTCSPLYLEPSLVVPVDDSPIIHTGWIACAFLSYLPICRGASPLFKIPEPRLILVTPPRWPPFRASLITKKPEEK